jgi:hypothetical protein
VRVMTASLEQPQLEGRLPRARGDREVGGNVMIVPRVDHEHGHLTRVREGRSRRRPAHERSDGAQRSGGPCGRGLATNLADEREPVPELIGDGAPEGAPVPSRRKHRPRQHERSNGNLAVADGTHRHHRSQRMAHHDIARRDRASGDLESCCRIGWKSRSDALQAERSAHRIPVGRRPPQPVEQDDLCHRGRMLHRARRTGAPAQGCRHMQAVGDGPGRSRTCDRGIKSPPLYQLSYRPATRIMMPACGSV